MRCCAVLCGAVLLSYCRSAVLELQHELLHHGVDPRGDTAGMCATWLPWPFSRTYLHRRAWRSRRGGCHFFDQVYKQIVTGVVLGMQCAIAAGQYPYVDILPALKREDSHGTVPLGWDIVVYDVACS